MLNLTNMLMRMETTEETHIVTYILIAIVFIIVLVAFLLVLKFARLWLQAYFSRADVKLSELIGMWLRKVEMKG